MEFSLLLSNRLLQVNYQSLHRHAVHVRNIVECLKGRHWATDTRHAAIDENRCGLFPMVEEIGYGELGVGTLNESLVFHFGNSVQAKRIIVFALEQRRRVLCPYVRNCAL